jgi:transaldolase
MVVPGKRDRAGGETMNALQRLHDAGQSLWLDNITRQLLISGRWRRYIDEFSITGLTSNPAIFEHAIKNSADYDAEIRQRLEEGRSGEALFFDLALTDLRQAAGLFRPTHERTNGVDGPKRSRRLVELLTEGSRDS